MKREIWEELVDRAVDDECDAEEKRALEEAAARDSEIRAAYESALLIRELLRRSAGATVPPNFAERMRLAIERSDFWIDREIERPTVATRVRARFERLRERRSVWAAAALSLTAVALWASNFNVKNFWGGDVARLPSEPAKIGKIEGIGRTENGVAIPRLDAIPELDGASEKLEKNAPNDARPDAILTPLNEGETPTETVVATPSDFYTRRLLEGGNERRLLTAFLRMCNRIDVKFEKIDGDFELFLPETTPETRRQIFDWLETNAPKIAERGKTNLAERWDSDDEKTLGVRISFVVAEN